MAPPGVSRRLAVDRTGLHGAAPVVTGTRPEKAKFLHSATVPQVSEPEPEIIRQSLERLVERLRSASDSRLNRADDRLGGNSLARATYDLAAWCVSAVGQLTNTRVPELARLDPFASGDQLWVTANELLYALENQTFDVLVLAELDRRIELLRSVS